MKSLRLICAMLVACALFPVWADGILVTFESGGGDPTALTPAWVVNPNPAAWTCVVSSGASAVTCPEDGFPSSGYPSNHTLGGEWGLRIGYPNLYDGINPYVTLSLAVPTIPGTTYDVSYWVSYIEAGRAREVVTGIGESIAVAFGGASIMSTPIFINDPFAEQTGSFMAIGATTFFEIQAWASLSGDFYIDDIAVTAQEVPEPTSLALLAVPLALLAWRRRGQ